MSTQHPGHAQKGRLTNYYISKNSAAARTTDESYSLSLHLWLPGTTQPHQPPTAQAAMRLSIRGVGTALLDAFWLHGAAA